MNSLGSTKYMISVLWAVMFFSCSNDDDIRPPKPEHYKHTAIIYMSADNNLYKNALEGLELLEKAQLNSGENLIVYVDMQGQLPQLLKIENNETKVIRTYIEQNSAESENLRYILNNVLEIFPSDTYGLILWSHGSSWLPPQNRTKSFGSDNFNEMDISELSKALPIKFDYIIFDACFMGGIEVLYELKDKTDYIISSPTEILTSGFPYAEIAPYLFGNNEESLVKIAKVFFDYYDSLSGNYQSASISLIKTEYLKRLAILNNQLIHSYNLSKWDYNQDKIQSLDLYPISIMFDYYDFLTNNYPPDLLTEIDKTLNNLVLYKAHTEYFLGKLKINNFSGISCYVPSENYRQFHNYYQSLAWTRDSAWDLLL